MLLVIDVGNTNTSLGIYEAGRLRASWRLTTRREQTADEWGVFIQTLLATRGIEQQHITGVAISNVVPPIQQALEWMCDRYFGVSPLTVEPGVTADLPLNVDVPREVGADRVVSCVAGIALYGTPLIVVDFGTATRFDCVNARGEFIGGAIAPGINTAAEALVSRAARLFRVELVRPKDAIGRHTVTNIQSGMIYGWAGLVDGLVERMRREMEGDVKIVGTGGLVAQMREVVQCLQFVNPDLKLEGLRMLWERAHPGTSV